MELTLLPDGIYERVISDELGKVLDEASKEEQIWKETETVDSQEGARYLSDYAGRLIHCCLKEIADQDEEGSTALSKELHLVNDLIRLLSKRMETLGEGHTVSREDFLLTQLKRRQNTLKEIILERPLSGLSHSTLFTNSKKDVSLVTELQREIQSADRIDLLVSFIKYSGYIMIRPYLQEFTRHGGKLRVLTTTYMGATDPKAVAELAALPNTEVRISYNVKETRLHAKAYIFYRSSGFSSAYVGSSNLSHAAIADGLEWNMKITQQDMPLVMEKIHTTFDTYWHSDEFQDFSEKDRPHLEDAIDAERGRGKKEGSALSMLSESVPTRIRNRSLMPCRLSGKSITARAISLLPLRVQEKPPLQLLITLALPKIETRKPVFFLWPTGRKSSPNPFPPFVKSSKIQALGNFP